MNNYSEKNRLLLTNDELTSISGGFEWGGPEGYLVEALGQSLLAPVMVFTKKQYSMDPKEKTIDITNNRQHGTVIGVAINNMICVGFGTAVGAGILGTACVIKNKLSKKKK